MTSSNDSTSDPRLPRDVAPARYEIRLRPDLDAARFTGDERIEISVHEATREIVCNAAELDITSAVIAGRTAQVRLDEADQRAYFIFEDEIEAGDHVLELAFSGILNDQLRGFYRSTFKGEDGSELVIATTQFEATDARRAFPCWDEPDRKAIFSITLDVPEHLTAVSNWPEAESESLGDGLRRVRFADTIPMSTYIVAFVVGPLEITGPRMAGDIPIRVVHPPGKAALTDFAFEVAEHSLGFYVEWFGLPYPGVKMDLLAIPDFAAGAMENLGAVTFREAELLIDVEHAAHSELERVAEVIEHEIAHMWFGDLVTMRWWNGIWLNEAFATFMSLLCLDDFRPDWRIWDSFARSRGMALQIDALHSTRPIEYPVHRPEDAEGMFDLLTYEKGASVLRMVERYLGAGRFREGVRSYLAAHLQGNTETTDLWDAIEAVCGDEPIRALMDSWILQGGYPLVHVEAPDGAATGLQVSQQPFALLADTERSSSSGIGRDWLVPLIVASRAAQRAADGREAAGGDGATLENAPGTVRRILGGGSEAHSLSVSGAPGDLVVANVGGHGFYRVRYDQGLFSKLLGGLDRLSPLERYCLISDTWACALSGAGSLEEFLLLAGRLEQETDASVWTIITSAMSALDRSVSDSDRPVLREFCTSLLAPQLQRVGWEPVDGEDSQSPTLRSALISSLAMVGHDEEVIEACKKRVADARDSGGAIEAGTARAVFAVWARYGGEAAFEQLWEGYRNPSDPQDEQRHLGALASVAEPEIATRVHTLCLDDIRSQDAPYLLMSMMFNRLIRRPTWEFVTSRWDDVVARYPRNSLPRLLGGIVGLDEVDESGNAPLAEEAVRFVADHPLEGMQKLVDQHLEILDVSVRFIRRERPRLGQLLGKL